MSKHRVQQGAANAGTRGEGVRQAGLVALVGRPNVGKSALFNRLAGRRISIVHDKPGVTRDRITARCRKTQPPCTVMDTGGIGANLDDEFAAQVRAEAEVALVSAGLVLLVVDSQEGLQPVDAELAQLLRREAKQVILVVNKVDSMQHKARADEFTALGFSQQVSVSAEHGRGVNELLSAINGYLKEAGVSVEEAALQEGMEEEKLVKLALAGRPNAGKSSLVNALLGDERAIVSEVSGTTRDALDVPWKYGDQQYLLIDTAGIRRQRQVEEAVEAFSVMRSQRAIERADIVALVVDCAGGVKAQDRRVARMILAANRPCIIVANKFDLFHPGAPRKERLAELQDQVRRELFFLHYAPILACSAKEVTDVRRLHAQVEKVRLASRQALGTGELNRHLRRFLEINPPPNIKGKRFKLFYATLIPDDRHPSVPLPRLLLFVNDPSLLSDNYKRYLENSLRETGDYTGLPIQFIIKARQRRD